MAIGDLGNAKRAAAVTKSDTTLVNARGLYVGGAGDVVVILIEDFDSANPTSNTTTFSAVPVGTILPVAATKVMDATTATAIVALY